MITPEEFAWSLTAADALADDARMKSTAPAVTTGVVALRFPNHSLLVGIGEEAPQVVETELLPGHVEDRIHRVRRYVASQTG